MEIASWRSDFHTYVFFPDPAKVLHYALRVALEDSKISKFMVRCHLENDDFRLAVWPSSRRRREAINHLI